MVRLRNPRTHKQGGVDLRRLVVRKAGGTSAKLVGASRSKGR